MGEDSSHADRSTATLPGQGSSPPTPIPQENQELLTPSFSPSSAPSSPTHTLSRLAGKGPASPTSPGGQVSAITVMALLDKLANMIEVVQENQRRMERKQTELEGAVRGVQGDVTRLTKSHTSTSNSVAKLLERSRKTGGHVKEVRERLEKQSTQVKRLEANHSHLLKRNHFKVIIFQEDNEIPSTVFMKDPSASASAASLRESQVEIPASVDANRSHEEGLHTISLTSDEEDDIITNPLTEACPEAQAEFNEEELPGPGEHLERSRADKFKRSSLKKVGSLKKAFSRQSIEKKINKIVPPERREKIKKSFTPNHPKSPTTKSSSFRVSPMTFNVKKVRDGDGGASPSSISPVEVPSMGGPDGQLPVAEVHSHEEVLNGEEPKSPSLTGSMNGGHSSTEEGEHENSSAAGLAEEEVLQEREDEYDDADHNDDDNVVKEEEEEEEGSSPVAAEASVSNPVAVGQAS